MSQKHQKTQRPRWLPALAALAAVGCIQQTGPVLSDSLGLAPVAPLPSSDQLAWQTQELTAFLHFGIDTFTDKEQGDGTDSPTVFNPGALDATQWMAALKAAGVRQVMLTAKHHDGFCLWPSQCTPLPQRTPYTVAQSPWLGGKGDVVQQFVDAAHQANMRVGLALSPLDRHEEPTTPGTSAYQPFFECQVRELLTNYGPLDELWLWGSPPPISPFDWTRVEHLVHQLQPNVLLDEATRDATGADLRSAGQAVPNLPMGPIDENSVQPAPGGPTLPNVWYPAESAFSIRPGWFWHPAEDTKLKTLNQLVGLYFDSVGRNSILLLGVPPNTQGLLADPDVAALDMLGAAIRGIYQSNLAAARPAVADSVFKDASARAAKMAVDGKLDTFWAAGEGKTTARLEVDLGGPVAFNLVSVQEPIALGERITEHHLEAKVNGVWTKLAMGTGTVVGERKLHRVGPVMATGIALVITQARGVPAVAELGVYQSSFP
ncbi:MAG TPA: alpha-L-fucosidase [Polyangia bacterium]|jgi:alpha-L-fucosidase